MENVRATKILDTLDLGGNFTESYAMDFTDDVILMGHDGPRRLAVVEGKTISRPLQVYHDKVGCRLSAVGDGIDLRLLNEMILCGTFSQTCIFRHQIPLRKMADP